MLTDFDTPYPIRRENKHNKFCPTWKMNYAQLFLPLGYSFIEKRSFCHSNWGFNPNIQERVSTQIMFKESIDDIYIA